MSLLLIKDLSGWRLEEAFDGDYYDGIMYKLKSGEMVGKLTCFIPAPINLIAMRDGTSMTQPEGMMQDDLDDKDLFEGLNKMGFGVNSDLRIYGRYMKPFTDIKRGQIMPIILGHLSTCEKAKKNPEQYPVKITWYEEKLCLMFDFDHEGHQGVAVTPIPEMSEIAKDAPDDGKFIRYKDRMGNVLLGLKCNDYFVFPTSQFRAEGRPTVQGMKMIKFVDGETYEVDDRESVQEILEGGRYFVNEFGALMRSGSFMAISIDDFLK